MRWGRTGESWVGLLALGTAACVGSIGGGEGESSGGPGKAPPISEQTAAEIGVSGLRRLTVGEYQATVVELLGIEAATAREILPVDTLSPFDNDYTLQIASEALIKGAELLAGDLAEAVIADPAVRSAVVGCEPSNGDAPLGLPSDLHEITHGSIGDNEGEMQDALADCAAFHVEHFARLTQKLRDTEDVDGSSLLDNTALVLAFEGGWGFDLEANIDLSPHSTENMVMLVGGKAGGLNQTPGRHIVKQGTHPVAVINTVIKAVGVDATMGEVTETVDELIG